MGHFDRRHTAAEASRSTTYVVSYRTIAPIMLRLLCCCEPSTVRNFASANDHHVDCRRYAGNHDEINVGVRSYVGVCGACSYSIRLVKSSRVILVGLCAPGTETRMAARHQSLISTRLKQTDFASVRRFRQLGGSRGVLDRMYDTSCHSCRATCISLQTSQDVGGIQQCSWCRRGSGNLLWGQACSHASPLPRSLETSNRRLWYYRSNRRLPKSVITCSWTNSGTIGLEDHASMQTPLSTTRTSSASSARTWPQEANTVSMSGTTLNLALKQISVRYSAVSHAQLAFRLLAVSNALPHH